MIVTDEVVHLISQIEKSPNVQLYLKELIHVLEVNCLQYSKENSNQNSILSYKKKYPIVNGFAQGFDPLTESQSILECWRDYGFVVGKNVVSEQACNSVINKGYLQNLVGIFI